MSNQTCVPVARVNPRDFLFSADCQSGKKAEITSRVAANFVGWEKDPAQFDRELEKVIRALRMDYGGRKPPPPARRRHQQDFEGRGVTAHGDFK